MAKARNDEDEMELPTAKELVASIPDIPTKTRNALFRESLGPDYVHIKDAAIQLGVSIQSLRSWIRQEGAPHVRGPGNPRNAWIFINIKTMRSWIDEQAASNTDLRFKGRSLGGLCPSRQWLYASEAARCAGCSRERISQLLDQGRFGIATVGGHPVIRMDDFAAWVSERRIEQVCVTQSPKTFTPPPLTFLRKSELARILGVYPSTITNWIHRGLPVEEDGTLKIDKIGVWLRATNPGLWFPRGRPPKRNDGKLPR